jgi:NET1-associated nuclear protein 1 (U3 small nucleolar RNA-associated protein 17)
VSGGLETVLVLWQVETTHKQFLPHLGAAIKNVVVSPRGASYALSLSDNSVMVISTSELKPKANIAGIQSHAQNWPNRELRTVPCLLHPTKANSLLIATPSNQLDQSTSSPYLQTFDTYSDRHVSRQALTRSNATILNQGPDKTFVSEPDISFLAATSDGQWLASVDEWAPAKPRGSGEVSLDYQTSRRREVYLKFWRWSEQRKEWELVTRVDSPHPSPEEMGSESILDLIVVPNGQAFVTVGADGSAKIWKPKLRMRPGATETSINWGHRHAINFSKKRHTDTDVLPVTPPISNSWGHAAFSDDSSVLAVSCPDPGFGVHQDSLIHLIDPSLGTIRQTLGGLQIGRTSGLAIVDRYLTIAGSQKLLVWNLVHARVEWEYTVQDLAQRPVTLHLAVDQRDHTIAVAFSKKNAPGAKILVWHPASDPNPAYVAELDAAVAALKSVGPGKGFFVLDAQARVQYVAPALAAHASVATILESGQEVEEDTAAVAAVGMLSGMYIDDTRGEDRMDIDNDEEEGATDRVVSRERLEEVFDGFETYEQGAVEVAFDRVMQLFAKKPLGEEEEENEDEDEDEGNSESEQSESDED